MTSAFMHSRSVAAGQDPCCRGGCEDGDFFVTRKLLSRSVSVVRPRQHDTTKSDRGLPGIHLDEHPVREITETRRPRWRSRESVSHLREDRPVHVGRRRPRPEGPLPRRLKRVVIRMPAFATRTMACGQCGRFIKKEQLRVFPGGHQRSLPTVEIEPAAHPRLHARSRPDDGPLVVVQAAAIAHEHPTGIGMLQRGIRIDSVLKPHTRGRWYANVDRRCA